MTIPYFRNPYRVGTRGWLSEQFFTLDNFAGGLNNVEPDTTIADNEATDCCNMRFLSGSLMEKRPGTSLYDETNYPALSAPITWIDTYSPTLGESKIVRGTSSEVYIGSDKICDVDDDIRGVTYIGKYYFVDGKALRVYDEKKCYRVIAEPKGHLSKTSATNGNKFKLEKVPEQLKVGNPVYIAGSYLGSDTPFTSTVSAINGNEITFAATVSKSMAKDSLILFYTPADKSKTEGTEVWDGTTLLAWYNPCLNELADMSAGESYFPDSPNVITIHKDRIFVAGDSTQPHGVYMTANAPAPQPLYFPVHAGISVKPDGEEVVDLIVFDDALIIGRHKDMFVLYGSSEYDSLSDDPFYVKQMDTTVGLMNTDCGALLNNYYIYLGYDGRFYKLNTPTTYVEYLMTRPLDWKCDIYAVPFSISQNSIVKTSTVAYRNEVYFNIGEDLVIVYNFDNMAYTYFVGWKSKSLHAIGTHLLIGRTDGKLVKYDDDLETYDDLGVPVDARYHTKRYDLGSSINYKYFKSFMVTSHAYDDISSSVSIGVEIDYFDNPVNNLIDSNIARFGVSKWGMVRFNNRSLYKSPYLMLDVKGRTIKYKFSNNKAEPFRIYDINTLYTIRDVR